METIENKYITVAYKLYAVENGEKDFTEEASAEHPFRFISGLGMTLEAFETQIKDLKAGDKFDFTIAASEAYGDYDDDHVIELPKEVFFIEGKFDDERNQGCRTPPDDIGRTTRQRKRGRGERRRGCHGYESPFGRLRPELCG